MDVGLLQFAAIGLARGVDGAEARLVAGDQLREPERLVVLRDEQRDRRRLVAVLDLGDLAAEHVDVDVGRGEHDVLDLGRQAVVADRHLPQRFDGDVIAERMGEDRNLAHLGVVGQRLQHRFQPVAGIIGALAIIEIFERLAARGPGEQHRHDVGPGIVRDLREAVDRLLEARVVAVDEDQRVMGAVGAMRLWKTALASRQFEPIGAQRDEIARGSPGSCAGHCTSPILRTASGGIETAMSAKRRPRPRSPPNITPAAPPPARASSPPACRRARRRRRCASTAIRLPSGRPAQAASAKASARRPRRRISGRRLRRHDQRVFRGRRVEAGYGGFGWVFIHQ